MGIFFKTPEEKARILQIKLGRVKSELQVLQRTYPLQKRMNPSAAKKTEKVMGMLQTEAHKLTTQAQKLVGTTRAKKMAANT